MNLESVEEVSSRKIDQAARDKERLTQQLSELKEDIEAMRAKLGEETSQRISLQKELERMTVAQQTEVARMSKKCEILGEEKTILQRQLEPLKISEETLRLKLESLDSRHTGFK